MLIMISNTFFIVPVNLKAQHTKKYFSAAYFAPDSTSISVKSPVGAMIRSAILPGWGQVYNGKYIKALVYMGGESYFLLKFLELDDELNKLEEMYDLSLINGVSNDSTKRILNDIDDKEHERNGWGWLFAAGYLLAMGDAFVDAHLYGLNEYENLSLGILPNRSEKMLSVQLVFKF